MPLFGGRRDVSPEPVYEPEPPRKHGLFHRSTTPPHSHSPPHSRARTGSTARSSLSSSASPDHRRHSSEAGSGSRRGTGFLSRFGGGGGGSDMDPSIVQARQRVMDAEAAEKEADRALDESRLRVREAREDARRLEEEAKEDARRAKIKQHHAKEVSKRGKTLGRHGF